MGRAPESDVVRTGAMAVYSPYFAESAVTISSHECDGTQQTAVEGNVYGVTSSDDNGRCRVNFSELAVSSMGYLHVSLFGSADLAGW